MSIAQGDIIHSHLDDNDQQRIARPCSSVQQHTKCFQSDITTTTPVVVDNSRQQRQQVVDNDPSSRAADVNKARYNKIIRGEGLGVDHSNTNCEVCPPVSLTTSSMEYSTNKIVSADDQTNDSHSSSTTSTETSLSSSASDTAAAVIIGRTLKDSATTNAAATLLQVATSTADKKQNNVLCKRDNTITTNKSCSINLHNNGSHQQKSDTTLSDNINEEHLIGNKRRASSPIPDANNTAMDENSFDVSKHRHHLSYHHKQQQQYTSSTSTIPATTTIRRDSLPMGLRNKKMKPTDCLLFAATLLDQEVSSADNNNAFTDTRNFSSVSITYDDDPGGAISFLASSAVQQQQQHLETRENVASKTSPFLTMISATRSTPTNKMIQQQQQLDLVASGEKEVIVEKHKLQEKSKRPKQKQLQLQDHPMEGVITANKPKDVDVLCGRGGKVNKHPGNIVYRKVVDHNKSYYQSVHKKHRILVSKSIVQAILNNGGRFMGQKGDDKWVPIGFKKSVQKTSQALRERSNNNNSESSGGSARKNIIINYNTNTDDTKLIRQHQVLVGDQVMFSA